MFAQSGKPATDLVQAASELCVVVCGQLKNGGLNFSASMPIASFRTLNYGKDKQGVGKDLTG